MAEFKFKRTAAISATVVVFFITAAVLFIFHGELATIASVKKLNNYPLYSIEVSSDYALDELIARGGASNEKELVEYIIEKALKGIDFKIEYKVPNLGCSTFTAATPDGRRIFGRNFDNSPMPVAVVFTAPPKGYRSVSLVSLAFLGYTGKLLPDRLADRLNCLAAPYFPLDGINEKGVAVAVLQIMAAPTDQKSERADIITTMVIRMVLDHAASLDQAIEIFKKFDMHASANGCYQFHIADAAGDSAVISYNRNRLVITRGSRSSQVCTNFYLYKTDFDYKRIGIERYRILESTLRSRNSTLTIGEGHALLARVSMNENVPDEGGTLIPTQWSSLFDLSNRALVLAVGRDYQHPITFSVMNR